MTYLRLTNINKTFQRQGGDRVRGLDNISIEMARGEVLGIIGTNGAGKSTLFNVLAGLFDADSGRIELAGQDVTAESQFQLADRVARVFQNPSMGTAPRMTVFENLMLAQKRGQTRGFGISLTRSNREAMAEYLKTFNLDLEHRLDVPIENLSGGQRQTISLVMATLMKPQLLLLDEHTSALDPRTARLVMEMTQDLVREHGLTTIMITHHMQDALTYCDRIAVMHQGHLVQIYEADEVPNLEVGNLYEMLEGLVEIEARG